MMRLAQLQRCLKFGRRWHSAVSASQRHAARPDVADVERLARGDAAKRRGVGSRDVPHRLNESERAAWELAKRRRHLTLSGTGYRRERKGSPLMNSWRQYADASGWPAVMLQLGADGKPEAVVVDFSPLRAETLSTYREAREACLPLATAAGATVLEDGTESVDVAHADWAEAPIWRIAPVNLVFECPQRAAAKALAEQLASLLCGAALLAAPERAPRVRRPRSDKEEDDDEAL